MLKTEEFLELRNERVLEALPIVESILRRLKRKYYSASDVDDLRQIGMLALIDAAERYDERYGVPFQVWATQRVSGAIHDGLRSVTGLTRTQVRAIVRFNAPTPTEELPMVKKAPSVVAVVRGDCAADLMDEQSYTSTYEDPESGAEIRDLYELALKYAETLSTIEQELVHAHYDLGKSFAEIASDVGVSRSWVSRMHTRALERIRRLFSDKNDRGLVLASMAQPLLAAATAALEWLSGI